MDGQLAQAGSDKQNAVKNKADLMIEALNKGLKIPWMGVRPDLRLHKGGTTMENNQTYVIEDPISGHHYEIGEAEARFFLCLITEPDLGTALNKFLRTTSHRPSISEILVFLRMMQQDSLAVLPTEELLSEDRQKMREKIAEMKKKGKRKSIFTFTLPLLRPDPFLNIIYPWVSPLWSRPFLFLYAVLGMVGLIFTFQQIELYLHTVNHLFTFRGAIIFSACLGALKILHEFGHALASKHYGLFVRRMGALFIFFVPLFYTDTTEAWKLPSRKARIIIASAGVMFELVVAALALFFWSVLPDGMVRSMMFYLSGVSLVSTFFVNLNPLMRFDGYYILMDWLRISNLRPRSREMFKYYWRKIALDWQGPKPEEHPWSRGMAVYGLFAAVYLGVICVSIELMMFKIIQSVMVLIWSLVFLFIYLYLRPFLNELVTIFKQHKYWGSWKALLLRVAIVAGFIGFLFIPMPKMETLPAFFLYQNVNRVESPGRGRLVSELPDIGRVVQKGDVLVRIEDRLLEQERKKIEYELLKVEASIKTISGGGVQGGYRNWLVAEKQRLNSSLEKTDESLAQLEIRAPVSGKILDINRELQKGAYLNKKIYLFTVGNDHFCEIRAYADEDTARSLKEHPVVSAEVSFWDVSTSSKEIFFQEMLDFPVMDFPNDALFDYAGGPLVSVIGGSSPVGPKAEEKKAAGTGAGLAPSRSGVRTKLAYFPILFNGNGFASYLKHGTPCFVKVKGEAVSTAYRLERMYWYLYARLRLFK